MAMTWRELYYVIHNKVGADKNFALNHFDDTATVYDAAVGEYYPADIIEFEESDGIIDAGTMFISINFEKKIKVFP